MVGVKIVDCDLENLERGYIWLGLRSWMAILSSWNLGTYMVRGKIVDGDLEILVHGCMYG